MRMRKLATAAARRRSAGRCPRCNACGLVKREVWVPDPMGDVPRHTGDVWSCELHRNDESHYLLVIEGDPRETDVNPATSPAPAARTAMAVHRRRHDGTVVPVHRSVT